MSPLPLLRRPGVLLAPLAVAGCSDGPSALDPAGPGAREIASLWWVMLAAGTAVFVLVLAVLARVARHRDPLSPRDVAERGGYRWILLGGVVLPVVVLLPISFLTLRTGDVTDVGGADVEVEVEGSQFWWEVRYPGTGAITANEIHVPAGEPVTLTLTSRDVIHSFWVPEVHGKMDLVPGETTELVVEVDEPGVYEGLCAEFCGIQHTHMRMLLVAHEPDDFEAWLAREAADAAEPASDGARAGAEVFDETGCGSCHTVRGTDARGDVGPDLTHLASRRTLGANTIENTRGNLGGWVANSQHIKPGNRMPPSVVSGPELIALLDYLEGLE